MTLLVIDHEPIRRGAIEAIVREAGLRCRGVGAFPGAGTVATSGFNAMLVADDLPDAAVISTLKSLAIQGPTIPTIILCGEGPAALATAVAAVKAGAVDCIARSALTAKGLLAVVGKYTRNPPAPRPTSVSPLTIATLEGQRRVGYLMDHAGDALFIYERRRGAKFLEVNRLACEIAGYSREELLNLGTVDIVDRSPEQIHRVWDSLQLGVPITIQSCYLRKDRSTLPVEVRLTVIDLDGCEYILALARDITASLAARLAVQRSEARYRQLVETADEGIWVIDSNVITTFVNRKAASMLGWEAGEMLGQSLERFIFPEDWPRVRARITDRQAGVRDRTTVRHRCRDGSELWTSVAASRIYNEDGSFAGTLGMLTDISDRLRAEKTVRDTNQTLEAIFAHSPLGIIAFDADMVIQRVNPAALRIAGFRDDEVLGKNLCEVVPGQSQDLIDGWERLLAGEVLTGVEVRRRRRDGSGFQIRLHSAALRDGSGAVVGVVSVFADVTDEIASRAAIVESEARYRRLVETADEGIWVLDTSAITTFVNAKMAEMLGCTPSNIVGRSLQDFMFPEDWPAAKARLAEYPGAPRTRIDIRHRRSDGTALWSSISSTSIFDDNGEPAGALGMFTNIEERLRAENALRESNRNLEALFVHSPLGIMSLDRDLIVQRANPAAQKILGCTEDELRHRHLRDVTPGDPIQQERDWSRIMAGEKHEGLEISRCRPDGTELELRTYVAVLRNVNGEVDGVVAIFADITEQVRLKNTLLQAQKMEAVGRLAGGIAHDFGNMLAVISGYAEALLRHIPQQSSLRFHAEEIERAANRGALLIRQLLAFNRHRPGSIQRIHMSDVFNSVERMIINSIGEHIQLITEVEPELPVIEADHSQLEQLLINLALNARDAMPGGGTLTIHARAADLDDGHAPPLPAGPYVCIAVSDTGIGMDESTRKRIFDPFFTTKANTGTGLGLSIVNGIVTDLGGAIRVNSGLGKGTVFEMFFPVKGNGTK